LNSGFNGFSQILQFGAVQLYTTGTISLKCNGYIYGQNRDGAQIIACTGTNAPVSGCTSFTGSPVDGAIVRIELGNNTDLVDARVEGVSLNTDSLAGSIGVRAFGINENSAIERMAITNDTFRCIDIEGGYYHRQLHCFRRAMSR
jgi:hypothetical protein